MEANQSRTLRVSHSLYNYPTEIYVEFTKRGKHYIADVPTDVMQVYLTAAEKVRYMSFSRTAATYPSQEEATYFKMAIYLDSLMSH
jgi:hypothetical protein